MTRTESGDRAAIGTGRWLLWTALMAVYRPLAALAFRPRVTGADHLPDGGYLLLANHTALGDNLWVAAPTGRAVHFMTSANLLRRPGLGALLRALGCFPKTVGGRDAAAHQEVVRLVRAGLVVQIMPEGTRTWDGRLRPVRPGIGRLVRELGAPVVLCRARSGHLVWPRWARTPRWIPLVLEYEVRTWPADADPDDIWRDVVAGLTIEPVVPPGRVLTFRPAEGLTTYLWGCPRCLDRRVWARGDTFGCDGCGASWRVAPDLRLVADDPTLVPPVGASIGLAEAHDRLDASLDPGRDETADLELRRGSEVVRRGSFVLRSDRLVATDGWALPLVGVRPYMDAGNVLLLRTPDDLLRLVPDPADSTWRWHQLLQRRIDALSRGS